jgi:hypothetical protein
MIAHRAYKSKLNTPALQPWRSQSIRGKRAERTAVAIYALSLYILVLAYSLLYFSFLTSLDLYICK